MAIVPANPQIRPNPPAKTRPLRVILPVAGGFSIINKNLHMDAGGFGINLISGGYPHGYPPNP